MIYDPYCISCCAGAASGSLAGVRAQGRFELLRRLSGCRRAGKRSPRHCGAGQPRGGRPQNSGRADPGRQLCRPGIPCPQAAFPLAHGAGRRAGGAGAGLLFLPALQGHPRAAGRACVPGSGQQFCPGADQQQLPRCPGRYRAPHHPRR